jgi:hypothetical protein
MEKLVEVKAHKVFGRIDYKAANDLGVFFQEILGKPNLPLDVINKLKEHGYTVQEVVDPTL